MRKPLTSLLLMMLLLAGAISTSAQVPCSSATIRRIYDTVISAGNAINADNDPGAVEALIAARETLALFLAQCGDPMVLGDRFATPEPPPSVIFESTPVPTDPVTISAEGVVLPQSFIASTSDFTVNLPGGYSISEDQPSVRGTEIITVGLSPDIGNPLPAGGFPLSLIYGDPTALSKWTGLVDSNTFVYDELDSLRAAVSDMSPELRADLSVRDLVVYPITVRGYSGLAVRLGVTYPGVDAPLEALIYYVEVDPTHLAAFAQIANAGELDALIPTLNAIAVSFKPAD